MEGRVGLSAPRVSPIGLESLEQGVNAALPSAAPAQQAGGERGDRATPVAGCKGRHLRDRSVPFRLLRAQTVIVTVVAAVVVPIVRPESIK